MKTISTILKKLFLFQMIVLSSLIFAQTETPEKRVNDLPRVTISDGVSLHIISPEPIQFVDLSTNNIIGDLPAENIARIKIADSSADAENQNVDKNNLGIITIVSQSFMAQYKLDYESYDRDAVTNIQIQPEDMQPLDYPKMKFSNIELGKLSLDIIRKKKVGTPIRDVKDFQIKMMLNNVYVMNDYIFLDMSFQNATNLAYSIDGIKFSVEDKKIYKATNNQSIDMEPVYQLYPQKEFKKTFRNIYVFKKFTFPNSKVMKIRLVEEQLSGRTIEMEIKYSDILSADTF